MAFFKHLGTKASKFQFNISIDNVVGVYPSNYSVDDHSTEGIYAILKRKNKSYRTKIALPENGGHVYMNDCITFTSTLYQKKKKGEEVHTILPKLFILRVCNGSNSKMRWESCIDISDYASVFGVDSHESFILQFVHKSKIKHRIEYRKSLSSIPSKITVRIRIKSIWLKNIDTMSHASTGSVSRMSSSALSELSDVSNLDNFKLFDTLAPAKESPLFNNDDDDDDDDDTRHKYRSLLFKPLPEEHSLHPSPIKSATMKSTESIVYEEVQNDHDTTQDNDNNDIERESALDSFKQMQTKPLALDSSFDEEIFERNRIRNLSFIQSPTPGLKEKLPSSQIPADRNRPRNASGFFMESELIRIESNPTIMENSAEDNTDSMEQNNINIKIEQVIDLIISHCIHDMKELNMQRRLWNNLIPIHTAIVFRCFIHWNAFEVNKENTHLILQAYIDAVTQALQEQNMNDAEQSYWLLRLTTITYWMHIYFPHKMIVSELEKSPKFRRYETFEPILSGDDDDDEEVDELPTIVNRNSSIQSVGNYSTDSNDCYVEHQINSENTTDSVDRIPIERTDDHECIDDDVQHIVNHQKVSQDEHKSSDSNINLQYWFVQKIKALSHICFNNIIDNAFNKLGRIPFEHVFDKNEFGETGSNTMDMIFAVMNSIWFLFDDKIKVFYVYKVQICRQILQYTIYVGLLNNLLQDPSFCTVAGGFRLKIIKSMIVDWCQSNNINLSIFSDLIALLDQLSALLLTCAVTEKGEDLLNICPLISAAQINQILNNYNTEPSNEPLSAEILAPVLEAAAAQLSPNNQRVSVQSLDFSRESMQSFDLNVVPLPTIALGDVPTPYNISQIVEFAFLMNTEENIVL